MNALICLLISMFRANNVPRVLILGYRRRLDVARVRLLPLIGADAASGGRLSAWRILSATGYTYIGVHPPNTLLLLVLRIISSKGRLVDRVR